MSSEPVEAFSPLVDEPFRGTPIYLRSSSHDLPDIVVDLKGIEFGAHNGVSVRLNPVVKATGCKGKKRRREEAARS